MAPEGYRCGLENTHSVGVWFDHRAFEALRAEGRKTVQDWALKDARDWLRWYSDSWLYDATGSLWVFLAENHQELPEGRSCDGGLGGCEVCGADVLVSNGRGESIYATWDAVRRVGGTVP